MKYKLSDIAIKVTDGEHGTVKDNENGQCYLLSCKNIKNGRIEIGQNERRIDNETMKTLNKRTQIEKGDILITTVGTIGEMAMIRDDNIFYSFQRSVGVIKPDTLKVIPKYLYYAIMNEANQINTLIKGAVQKCLFINDLKSLEIDLPDLETQKKIVRILSALDQKIELNNQQSKALETATFALYDDLINNIDESDFKKISIGQIADCKLGGTPSRAKSEYWGGSINWINSGAINSFRITGPSELITEEGFKHTSTYMLPKGTTVLAITGATLGQVSRMEIEGCANQSVIGIVGNNAISNEYIYLTIVRNIQEIINRRTGGAQQHINKNDIKEFEIILPNQQLMNNFTSKVRPIFEKIAQNEFENKTLSSLRDTFLPKLMSGEINLGDVQL